MMPTLYSIILALSILLAVPTPPQKPIQRVPVEENMTNAQNNFNQAYGEYARIVGVSSTGLVEEPQRTVDQMMKTGVIFVRGNADVRPGILVLDPGKLTDVERSYLRDSLLLNVARGDVQIQITVQDTKSGLNYVSLNSMSIDGNRFSGIFLATARIEGGFRTSMRLPNTVCQTEVLTRYLWGSAAETAEGCVRAICQGEKCTDCTVIRSEAFGGFFGTAKIVPDAGTSGRKPTANCCEAYFKWTWVTGFKSIKVSVDKVSLGIEGQLGQSGNGSFTVTECCTTRISN
jgi:hypothetical protein